MTSKVLLVLLWLGVILLCGLLISVISGYTVISSLVRKNIIEQTLPLTADNIYSEVQRDVVRPIFISSVMAQDTFLRDWVLHGEKDLDQLVRYLREIKNKYNTFTSYFISEKSRRYYYPGGILKTVKEKDSHDKWYFSMRQIAAPYRLDIDTDQANRDALTIFINYRVFDYRGNFIGITGVGLKIDEVTQLIDKYEARFQRRIYFVNHEGVIVLAGKGMAGIRNSIREQAGIRDIADNILSGTLTPIPLEYPRDGATILVNSRFIPDLGLYLIVEQNQNNEIRSALNNLVVKPIVGAIVVVVVVLAIGVCIVVLGQYRPQGSKSEQFNDSDVHLLEFLSPRRLAEINQAGTPVSLLLVAIDSPTWADNEHQHVPGAQTYEHFMLLTHRLIRKSDSVVPWDASTFLVLLTDAHVEQAFAIAHKIKDALSETTDTGSSNKNHVSLSIGVAQYIKNESAAKFFARADMAVHQAIQEGGNCVKVLTI